MITRTGDIVSDLLAYRLNHQGSSTALNDVHDIFRLHTDAVQYLVNAIHAQRDMNTELLKRLDEMNKELAAIHGIVGEE